jgi:hypothetical protein
MASIPLSVNVPQPANPLDELMRVTQVKNLLLQNQTAQLQNQEVQQDLEDVHAARLAWQSSGGDPDAYFENLRNAGVSPKFYWGQQQSILQMKKANADLDEVDLKNAAAKNDAVRGDLLSAINAPDAQKQTQWDAVLTREEQDGHIKPGTISHQYPGDDIATSFANHYALGSALAKEAIDDKTAAARAKTAQTGADRLSAEQNPNSPLYGPTPAYLNSGASGQGGQTILSNEAAQAGNVAGAQAAAKQPYELQLENVRQQIAQSQQINKDARDKIESTVLKPYEDKMSSISELNSAVDQASNGNVAAARGVLLKLMGVTNPDGTKRYNEAEASRMLSMGSVPQRVAGSVKNLLTGDNWTPEMASDIKSFADAQGNTASDNLNRGIANVNKLYNTNVGSGLRQTGGEQPVYHGGQLLGYTVDGKTISRLP